MTSLEMAGFSISILKVNEKSGAELLECLDSPSEALGWSSCGGLVSRDITAMRSSKQQIADPLAIASDQNLAFKRKCGPESSDFGKAVTIKAVEFACEGIAIHKYST